MSDHPCRLAVLGDPIRHSLSPLIHNRWLAEAGIHGGYFPIHTPLARLENTVQQLQDCGFTGCNLTLPLKEHLPAQAGRLPIASQSPEVVRTGAANTVVLAHDGWHLHNTDLAGLAFALADLGWVPAPGQRVLVLGAGGAARAAVILCSEQGAEITVMNRTPERANQLAKSTKVSIHCAGLTLTRDLPHFDAILQTTSAWIDGGGLPLPGDLDLSGTVVLDMMYEFGGTPFSRWANERGAIASDGLAMLVAQAAESFHCWTDQRPDIRRTLAWLKQRSAFD